MTRSTSALFRPTISISADLLDGLKGSPTSGCWIGHYEANGLLGINDEDAANGESNAFLVDIGRVLVIQHIIGICHFALLVANDGKFQSTPRDFVDVLDPSTPRHESAFCSPLRLHHTHPP